MKRKVSVEMFKILIGHQLVRNEPVGGLYQKGIPEVETIKCDASNLLSYNNNLLSKKEHYSQGYK